MLDSGFGMGGSRAPVSGIVGFEKRLRIPNPQSRITPRLEAEVPVRLVRRHAPARGADQEALLDQVRLDHVLERAAFLAQRRGQRFDADRAAVEVLDDRSEEHTSELQSLMRISYAVLRVKKKKH